MEVVAVDDGVMTMPNGATDKKNGRQTRNRDVYAQRTASAPAADCMDLLRIGHRRRDSRLLRGAGHQPVQGVSQPTTAGVKLRFMDGPYWVTVVSQEDSSLLLRCTEDRQEARILHEINVSTSDLRSEVAKFAHELLQACSKQGIRETDDLEQLKRRLLN